MISSTLLRWSPKYVTKGFRHLLNFFAPWLFGGCPWRIAAWRYIFIFYRRNDLKSVPSPVSFFFSISSLSPLKLPQGLLPSLAALLPPFLTIQHNHINQHGEINYPPESPLPPPPTDRCTRHTSLIGGGVASLVNKTFMEAQLAKPVECAAAARASCFWRGERCGEVEAGGRVDVRNKGVGAGEGETEQIRKI